VVKNLVVGVLALQGGFDPHLRILAKLGVTSRKVLDPLDLAGLSGLILPGGESTTIGKMMARFGLLDAIPQAYTQGLALFGTCAGMILLATEILGYNQIHLGLLNITVERNAYGPQLESFESEVVWKTGKKSPAVFIRAPIIRRLGSEVQVLAEQEGLPVLIKQDRILASSFHPELTEDLSVHQLFVELCASETH